MHPLQPQPSLLSQRVRTPLPADPLSPVSAGMRHIWKTSSMLGTEHRHDRWLPLRWASKFVHADCMNCSVLRKGQLE